MEKGALIDSKMEVKQRDRKGGYMVGERRRKMGNGGKWLWVNGCG